MHWTQKLAQWNQNYSTGIKQENVLSLAAFTADLSISLSPKGTQEGGFLPLSVESSQTVNYISFSFQISGRVVKVALNYLPIPLPSICLQNDRFDPSRITLFNFFAAFKEKMVADFGLEWLKGKEEGRQCGKYDTLRTPNFEVCICLCPRSVLLYHKNGLKCS